jgi:Uncharacterised nucleotidyltransferase
MTYNDSSLKEWLSSILRGDRASLLSRCTEADIDHLIRIGENEGITALLRNQLEKHGYLDTIPEKFASQLKALEFQHVALNLSRQSEVKKVLNLLRTQELDFVLMKGEALANTIYPAPHMRTRCDTDLLFRDKKATGEAWLTLKKEGYAREQTLEGKFVGYQFSCSKLLGTGVTNTFDVHNEINDYLWFAKKFPFDELYSSALNIDYCGLQVKCFNSAYALMHANLHRVSNKPLGIQDRLIWLYDIHLLCRSLSHSEWEAFCCLAQEKEMSRVCLEGIQQASYYLHTEIPNRFLATLTGLAAKEPRGLNGMNQRWQLYVHDWLNNKGVVNKIRQLKEHLFPSSHYMMRKYQLTTKSLLPYFYLKRLCQGIVKYR